MHISRSTRLLSLLVCLGLIVGWVALLAGRSRTEPVADATVASPSMVSSSARAPFIDERASVPQVATLPPPAADIGVEVVPQAPLTESEVAAQREQEQKRLFAQVDSTFAAQPAAPAWSASMSARIDAEISSQPLQDSSLDKVECRTSICRLDFSIQDEAALETIRERLQLGMADVLSTGISKRDETGRFIVYLATDPQALGLTAQP